MRLTSWIRKLAFVAIIWSVALVVLLAGAELVLRVTDDGWGRTLRLNIIRNRTYDFSVARLYDSATPIVRYHRNAYGLRDDCASPAAIDILTVGGSTTDQRYIAQDATYQAVMEKQLSDAAGRKVCVSNAGVDGHSTYGHLLAFRDWFPLIPHLKPKLFVFFVGINDADFDRGRPSEFDTSEGDGLRESIKRLRVVQLALWAADTLGNVMQRDPAYAGHIRTSKAPAEYTETRLADDTAQRAARNAEAFRLRLRRLLADAHAYGADVLCVTQPHRSVRTTQGAQRGLSESFGWNGKSYKYGGLDYDYSLRRLNKVMLEECGANRLVDLYGAPFDDDQFYDYVHATPRGTREEGQRIAQFIATSDLMARLRK